MNSGLAVELEEGGMVALIGLLLLPGVLWISKAKDATGTAVRSAVVVGLIAGALAMEAAMDRTANDVASEL